MRLPAAICALSLFALTACDPAGTAATSSRGAGAAEPVSSVDCDASLYQHLVGEPIELAQEVAYPGVLRIVGPEDFLTKDFDPSRLTVTTRGERSGDKVGRVFCG